MNELVSIVIPVYNVKQYLNKCIESVINQSYTNIQIILVDDGSTDGSAELCDIQSKLDSRIEVIHKPNGGLSDARNAGIDRSKGDWICFIDSDDFVSTDYVGRMLDVAIQNNAEIAICDPVHVFESGDAVFTKEKKTKVYANTDAIKEMWYQRSFLFSAWAKIYRRDLFNKNRFTKGIIYEDVDIMHEVFILASKIVYIDAKLYAYVHREGSITTQKFSAREFDILKICKKLVDFAEAYPADVRKAALAYGVVGNMRIFISAPSNNEYEEYVHITKSYLERNGVKVLFDMNTRLKLKAGILLFYINKKLFRYVHSKINRWS